MLGLNDGIPSRGLNVGERVSDVVNRGSRNACGPEHLQPFRRCPRSELGLEFWEELLAALVPKVKRGVPFIFGEIAAPDCNAETFPQRLLRASDNDPAIAGLEVLEWNDRLMCGVRSADGLVATRGDPRAHVGQLSERDLEERQIDVAPAPVPAGAPDCREQCDCRDVPTAVVRE